MSGLIYLFTGDGKGKTSAALGTVLRASCIGKKIAWVAWYKSDAWDISEKNISKLLPSVDFYLMGEGFFIKNPKSKIQNPKNIQNNNSENSKPLLTGGKVLDFATENEHKKAAQNALQKAKELLKSQKYFLLVCDELCNALHDRLLGFNQAKELINLKGETHLLLTGRNASKQLIDIADLVSEINKIKHPYDLGKSAIKGLDF